MGKKTQNYTDREDWTWKIGGKQGAPEIAKFAATGLSKFFVSNFPEVTTAKALWEICSKYGRVSDVYIPSKRTKYGKSFAFVTMLGVQNVAMLGVQNVEEMANSLATFYRLLANVVRFPKKAGVTSQAPVAGHKIHVDRKNGQKETGAATKKDVTGNGSYVHQWYKEKLPETLEVGKTTGNAGKYSRTHQEHSRTLKNTISFRDNISNLYNALGREEIWAAKRCQMGCLRPEPSTYIYTTRAALNK
ncbi:hypothetical protein LXL04_006775 [Taraxacum kok-saghyz]